MDDPAALAAAANRLPPSPASATGSPPAARRRAVEEFDHRVMAERSLAIYRRIARRPARPAEADGRVPIAAAPLVRP